MSKPIVFEPPMVIDFHAHLQIPGTEKFMQLHNFDRQVLLAGSTSNAKVLEFCATRGGRFLPFCWLDLTDISRAVDQAQQFHAQGFRGVKFQPMIQRFLPHENRLYPLWLILEKLRLPLVAHSGSVHMAGHAVNFADPSGWSQVALDFPQLHIVIAHMGGEFHRQALSIAEGCPNVWLDTANLNYYCGRTLPCIRPIELVERAIRYAGAHKVVFASEGMLPAFIQQSDFVSNEHRKYIFWKNALKILGEPEI